MIINVVRNYCELSKTAADVVQSVIINKPNAVLGLPTGSTPIGMYNELIRMYRERNIDFSEVTTFNLDEYYGMSYENEKSYHYYMQRNFFSHININPSNINIPNGIAKDIEKECIAYDMKIKECGGIDLLILGIGHNGHIGFNEPSNEMIMNTHLTNLAEETVMANARFFKGHDESPEKAITMGLEGIMSSRQIMLLVNGKDKTAAVRRLLTRDKVSPEFPASFLHVHNNVMVVINEDAIEEFNLIHKHIS